MGRTEIVVGSKVTGQGHQHLFFKTLLTWYLLH